MFLSSTHKSNFSNAIADQVAQSYLDKISSHEEEIERLEGEIAELNRNITLAGLGSIMSSPETAKEKKLKSDRDHKKKLLNTAKANKAAAEEAYNTYMASVERADVVSEGLHSENVQLQQQAEQMKEEAAKSDQFKKYALVGGLGLTALVLIIAIASRKK